jgi:hypothetical protein
MKHTSRQPQCTNKPLFIAIAQVQSDLYWQLIENFMYSMVQFDHIECSVMICVSDPLCVRMCADKHFPCFDYNYHQLHTNSTSSTEAEAGTTVHVMEQIATIKLFEVSNALEAGIHVLLLDLDVGFLTEAINHTNNTGDNHDGVSAVKKCVFENGQQLGNAIFGLRRMHSYTLEVRVGECTSYDDTQLRGH